MIPSSADIQNLENILLFGDSKSNLLDCKPLDHYEIELLNQKLAILYDHYLQTLNPPIAGNWGLISRSFQNRNGIILYNQFCKLKNQPEIFKFPEHFLNQISVIKPKTSDFAKRCEMLKQNQQEVMDVLNKIRGPNQIRFQLNERVLQKNQYTSQPGSLASDILEEFSYEEYVTVRSVWSQKQIEEQKDIYIPQIPNFTRRKRQIKRLDDDYFDIQKFETKKIQSKRARRPSQKRQFNLILKLVDQNSKKTKRKKTKRAIIRFDANNRIINQSKNQRIRHAKKRKSHEVRQINKNNRRQKQKRLNFKSSNLQIQQEVPQIFDDEQWLQDENTVSFYNYQAQENLRVQTRLDFNKIKIQRIDLSKIQFHDDTFQVTIIKDHMYIEQQLKHLTNEKKVNVILNRIIFNFLKQCSNIDHNHTLYLRIVSNIHSIFPNKPLISEFFKYHMISTYAKLVAISASYIVENQQPQNGLMGILVQAFQQIKRTIEQYKLNQLTAKYCVSQFLYHYFELYDKQLEVNWHFTIKSIKVIHNSLFESNNVNVIVCCRLVEKLLNSQGLIGSFVSSSTPTNTCIGLYSEYMSKLSSDQLEVTIGLLLDIQQKYPTFWTFQQFSQFLSLVEYDKRQWSTKTSSFVDKCIHIYVSQQLRLNNNNNNIYKKLLNQILKQTFLGTLKAKQSISSWHLIYMTVVSALLSYPLFRNEFVYNQILRQLDSVKVTNKNFMQIFKLLMESFQFSVQRQRQKFQSQFYQEINAKLGQYKELEKIRKVLSHTIDEEETHRQFMKKTIKNQKQQTLIEEAYSYLLLPSSTPQLFPLKLKYLIGDCKLFQILQNKNGIWKSSKLQIINSVYSFLTSTQITFQRSALQNSNEEDQSQFQKLWSQAKNYCKFLMGFFIGQFKSCGKSVIDMPLVLQSGDEDLIKRQFEFYGCTLAIKVLVEKTVVAQIIKYSQQILTKNYSCFSKNCGLQFNLLVSSKFIYGAIHTFIKWQPYKIIQFTEQFHQGVSSLILNLSFVKGLSQQRDQLIKLHYEVLNMTNIASSHMFWSQFVDSFKISNTLPIIDRYLQSLICVGSKSSLIQRYLSKYQKFINKIKYSQLSNLHQFGLCVMDVLFWILKSGKSIPKLEQLINILRANFLKNQSTLCLLSEVRVDSASFGKIFRFLVVLRNYHNNIFRIKQIVASFAKIQINKHYKSIKQSMSNNSPNISWIWEVSHLCLCFREIQRYSPNNQSMQMQLKHLIQLLLNTLYQWPEVDNSKREMVYNSTIQKLIQQTHKYKEFIQQFNSNKLFQKFQIKNIK